MVVGDLPFMAYQSSLTQAIDNAGRFLKEAGAAAVKLEGGASVSETIRAITAAGIPVQAHIGLTPQSVHQMGGYKVQRDEDRLLADAREVADAGAFSVVLEGIPSPIAEKITRTIPIPTIGIGAGRSVTARSWSFMTCSASTTAICPNSSSSTPGSAMWPARPWNLTPKRCGRCGSRPTNTVIRTHLKKRLSVHGGRYATAKNAHHAVA